MVTADPFIGQRVEKCQVLRPLSRGGYGTTYLAFDEELQAQRVIKVSHEPLASDPSSSRQHKAFLEEGLILSRLKHPQIVTLRAQGEFQKRRYMVLDFVEGFSLREILDRVHRICEHSGLNWRDVLDPTTASALVLSTLEPLAYAHEAKVRLPGRDVNGVAHRDISPGNLILGVQGDERGKVVLIDFGTAKTDLAEMVTMNQSLIGTLPYMSKPRLQKAQTAEQASAQESFWGEYLETRNDVHALGVLYAQMLLGKLPFRGESAPEILVSILDEANYRRLYQEIEQTFHPALEIIREMVVWYDVTKPLKSQAPQFSDAVLLKPKFNDFFSTTFPDKQPAELLQAFNKRLRDSELFRETTALVHRPTTSFRETGKSSPAHTTEKLPIHAVGATLPSVKTSTASLSDFARKTLKFEYILAQKVRRWPWFLLAFAMVAVSVGTAFWLRPKSQRMKTHSQGHLSVLEHLDGKPDTAAVGQEPESDLATRTNGAARVDEKTRHQTGEVRTQSRASKGIAKGRVTSPKEKNSTLSKSRPTKDNSSMSNESMSNEKSSGSELEAENPAGFAQASNTDHDGKSEKQNLPPLDKPAFLSLQNRLAREDTSAWSQLKAYLAREPHSTDLKFLELHWLLEHSLPNRKQRESLANLKRQNPTYLEKRSFKEQVAFWLWQVDLRLFQGDPSQENRQFLQEAGKAYIDTYGGNSAFSDKIKAIQANMPAIP